MTAGMETAVTFSCKGELLLGIAHLPATSGKLGVVFVAGAPQYRVGAHRLFVTLARTLSQSGIPAFRFDARGYGDSSGSPTAFEDMRADLTAAVEAFRQLSPGIEKIVLLGLCDGASAILLDGTRLSGIDGVILINPWAQPAQGRTKAMQRSYYLSRLRNWRTWPAALRGLGRRTSPKDATTTSNSPAAPAVDKDSEAPAFVAVMLNTWRQFPGPSLVVISQDDVTAAAFDAAVGETVGWRKLRKQRRVSRVSIKGADHTFSSKQTSDQMAGEVLDWLRGIAG